jgi:hypothetical protein
VVGAQHPHLVGECSQLFRRLDRAGALVDVAATHAESVLTAIRESVPPAPGTLHLDWLLPGFAGRVRGRPEYGRNGPSLTDAVPVGVRRSCRSRLRVPCL